MLLLRAQKFTLRQSWPGMRLSLHPCKLSSFWLPMIQRAFRDGPFHLQNRTNAMGSIFDTLLVIPFTNALLLIYAFVGDFGLSIILFTILVRLLTHPFMVSQIKSSAAMQELTQSDEYKKIQEKYKKEPEKLNQETFRMYQEHGINPLSSCLPMLLQLPIMMGFYWSIARAI